MLQPGGNTRPKSSSPTYRLAGGGLYRPHLPEKAPYSSGSTITRADASSHGVENPNALGTEAPGELLNSTGQASLVACPTPEAQATVESRAASWPDERGSVAACLTPLAGDYCLPVCKLQDFFNGPRSPQLPTSGTPSSSPALLRRPSKPPPLPTVVCQETFLSLSASSSFEITGNPVIPHGSTRPRTSRQERIRTGPDKATPSKAQC